MKTYGYLVAIESDGIIDPFYIKDAIGDGLSGNQPDAIVTKIDVECMGEIDVYPEETE